MAQLANVNTEQPYFVWCNVCGRTNITAIERVYPPPRLLAYAKKPIEPLETIVQPCGHTEGTTAMVDSLPFRIFWP